LLNRISQTIERYAMLQSGQRVGVAVSGGADSVCLLYALRELAPRWKLSLHVLHLDHVCAARNPETMPNSFAGSRPSCPAGHHFAP